MKKTMPSECFIQSIEDIDLCQQIPRWKIIFCDAYSIGRHFGKIEDNSKFITNIVTTNKLRSKCLFFVASRSSVHKDPSIPENLYSKVQVLKQGFKSKSGQVRSLQSEVGANITHKSRDHARGKCMRSSHARVELASYIYLMRPHHILFENISRSHVLSVYQLQFYQLSLWRKLRYSLLNVRELKITLW